MQQGEFDRALRRALTIFDEWNEVTGVFSPGSSWRYEVEAIIKDAVDIGVRAALGRDYMDVGRDEFLGRTEEQGHKPSESAVSDCIRHLRMDRVIELTPKLTPVESKFGSDQTGKYPQVDPDEMLTYQHRKTGGCYRLQAFAIVATNGEGEGTIVAVYVHINNPFSLYVRDLDEFVEKFVFEPDPRARNQDDPALKLSEWLKR